LWLVVLAVLVLGGVVEVIIYGYLERPGWIGSSGKQFWDYLDLLIVPAAIAIGVALINWMQNERQRQAEEIERERAFEVESRRAMDTALQAYLDKMDSVVVGEMLNRGKSPALIRARTLTLLDQLEGSRKRAVMQFLKEARLIRIGSGSGPLDPAYLHLHDADFSGADLTRMDLSDQYLRGVRLTKANLANTFLTGADLRAANLSRANLTGAVLGLVGLKLRVPGREDVDQGVPSLANLQEADLSYANLEGAQGWTMEQLSAARSLEGATMPDGQTLRGYKMPIGPTFEDWLREHE
jgi:hypothetical protein